jgi:hypothetical protein
MASIRVPRKRSRRKDSGYMLLLLMLAVAVMTITLLGVARNYRRGIVRDREVEMIHRGEQYERAVRIFYRKNGRYPNSLEELENTNKVRYLRKRYKDPMTKDGVWKLAHLTDITLKGASGLGTAAAAQGNAANNPLQANAGDLSSSATAAADADAAAASQNQNTTGNSGDSTTSTTGTGTSGNQALGAGAAGATGGPGTNNAANGQVLGGGGVLGVVSKSKLEGIHSFGEKTKYNEWFFIYDPGQDKGQLPVGPYNPNMYLPGGANGPNPSGTATPTGPGTGQPANSGSGSATPPTMVTPGTSPQ